MHGDNLAAVWKVAPYENKHINSALGSTLAAVVPRPYGDISWPRVDAGI